MNFPKRDELLFLTVCALPKASRIGFARSICCESAEKCLEPERAYGVSEVATAARYCMTFLVFSVFPAPDSPLYFHVNQCQRIYDVRTLRYKNALVLALFDQVPECLVCHGEDVRSRLFPAPSFVHFHIFAGVDR